MKYAELGGAYSVALIARIASRRENHGKVVIIIIIITSKFASKRREVSSSRAIFQRLLTTSTAWMAKRLVRYVRAPALHRYSIIAL